MDKNLGFSILLALMLMLMGVVLQAHFKNKEWTERYHKQEAEWVQILQNEGLISVASQDSSIVVGLM